MGTPADALPDLKQTYEVNFTGVFENELPAHTVHLSSFHLDKYEVTNAQYAGFIKANPRWGKDVLASEEHNGTYLAHWTGDTYPKDKAQHPVVNITWASAQSFCHWQGGQLPTEAQWEFAARGGDDREFPWGDQLPSSELVNFYGSDIEATTPVGTYPATGFGIHDLGGNVWEFLADVWQDEYLETTQTDPIAGGKVEPDEVREVTGRRAVRGASFGGSVVNLRTRWRDSHVVTNATGFVGFRCAYPAEQSEKD